MKYLWFLTVLIFIESAKAQVITVTNIKVSVTADSAATAREQALDKAHELAFQRLVNDNFPEKSGSLPTHDAVTNMVTNFSIDREKTTPTSYTASLTFQFDGPQVQAWAQQQEQSLLQGLPSPSQMLGSKKNLKITASYKTLVEWQDIKKALESFPAIQKVTVLSFSPQAATLEVAHSGSTEKLEQYVLQNGLLLSPQEGEWTISPNNAPLR